MLFVKSSRQRCSVKKVFLEISQNSQKNTAEADHITLNFLKAVACNFIKKETLAQVFPCEFCEISKNTFTYRTPPMAASGLSCKMIFSPSAKVVLDIVLVLFCKKCLAVLQKIIFLVKTLVLALP